MDIRIKLGMVRRLNPGCQQLYNPSKIAIMNRRSSLNVKINKVAMPQYEYILSKWVSPKCKIIFRKYVSGIAVISQNPSPMSGLCPSVSISKANIDDRSTTNHTSSDQNESPLLKVIVVTWRKYLTSSKER